MESYFGCTEIMVLSLFGRKMEPVAEQPKQAYTPLPPYLHTMFVNLGPHGIEHLSKTIDAIALASIESGSIQQAVAANHSNMPKSDFVSGAYLDEQVAQLLMSCLSGKGRHYSDWPRYTGNMVEISPGIVLGLKKLSSASEYERIPVYDLAHLDYSDKTSPIHRSLRNDTSSYRNSLQAIMGVVRDRRDDMQRVIADSVMGVFLDDSLPAVISLGELERIFEPVADGYFVIDFLMRGIKRMDARDHALERPRHLTGFLDASARLKEEIIGYLMQSNPKEKKCPYQHSAVYLMITFPPEEIRRCIRRIPNVVDDLWRADGKTDRLLPFTDTRSSPETSYSHAIRVLAEKIGQDLPPVH
ncbi:hypothetical protein J4464_05500 [Candidatus Woesearchaeota archaeon]|nr:hypothetical protein [Candidatus Woesearchaeota archaeon]